MLKKLRLTNFKAFGDPGLEVEPALITVLIGPNGTGKSSVLQSLLLLKQQGFGDNILAASGQFVDFGAYQDLVHQRNTQLPMQLEILTEKLAKNDAYYYGAEIADNKRVEHRLAQHDTGSAVGDGWRRRRALTADANIAISGEINQFLRNFILIPTMRGFVQLRLDPSGVTVDMPSLNYPDAWSRATVHLLAYKGPILPKVSPLMGRILGSDEELMDWLRMTWVHRE